MALQDDAARDKPLTDPAVDFGLDELFTDMQMMTFVCPMLADMNKYQYIHPCQGLASAKKHVLIGNYKNVYSYRLNR
ncbi:MAG: hypothetical protein ACTS77_01485 [Arsenophonus sp. NC-TX2-MAG3]